MAKADDVGGLYCEDCHVSTITEGTINPAAGGVRGYALDAERAKALWAKGEEWAHERF